MEECECPTVEDGWEGRADGDFGPEAFEQRFAETLAEYDLADADVEYDCDEFPCLAIIRQDIERDQEKGIDLGLRERYGEGADTRSLSHVSVGEGGKEHIVIYSVFPEGFDDDSASAEALDERFARWQRRTKLLVAGE